MRELKSVVAVVAAEALKQELEKQQVELQELRQQVELQEPVHDRAPSSEPPRQRRATEEMLALDIYHAVKRRCPEWSVTPHRVSKAFKALKKPTKRSGVTGSGSRGSKDAVPRAFPHDVVELRAHPSRKRQAQRHWRGQVLRVAGYDDGEASDDEDLPPGHCSVFWLGIGLEQWPNVLTKESSVQVLDRPWVLGDRVAKVEDPRSLGTIVGVNCRLRFSGVPGPTETSPEVAVRDARAVGGFRSEDWVAHEATRWVGKVEEAVFRVEVELCRRSELRSSRSKGRHKPAVCAFQVSSEGLVGLEPAGCEDVTPQELSPHFPGQRIRAPARLWRQAEWLHGSLGRRSPRRGTPICGVVSSVECCLLAVRWLAGLAKDSQPPDEWVVPESLRTLGMPNSSEGWAIGDHVQAPASWNCKSAVIAGSCTSVNVRWANGVVEESISSLKLCPRPHISAHDFLPHDFVTRSDGAGSYAMPMQGVALPPSLAAPQVATLDSWAARGNVNQANLELEANQNTDESAYYPIEERDNFVAASEILPSESLVMPQVNLPLGVVTSVNLQARTAVVQWAASGAPGSEPVETEEVSVFELTDHPGVDIRLGDTILVPEAKDLQWTGRVSALRTDGGARVELLDGSCQWLDVRNLIVVDDSEGSQLADDQGSQMGSEEAPGASSVCDLEEEQEEDCPIQAAHEEVCAWMLMRGGMDADEQTITLPLAGEETAEEEEVLLGRSLLGGGEHGAIRAVSSVDETSCSDRSDAASSSSATLPKEAAKGAAEAASTDQPVNLCSGGSSSSSSSPFGPSGGPPAFAVFHEDIEASDHFFVAAPTSETRQFMAAVRREMMVLRKGLLDGSQEGSAAPIIVRSFSSRSDLFRCMVVGPPGTPYALVPFFFDVALPPEYPREPPLAHFHAHYVGNERLNPNLYVDGKVCLSLLGTWSGPAWDSQRSTMLQVLVSLQGLVLVEEPYFNEPGHECDVGTEQGRQNSTLYNEHARLLALRSAINCAQSPPRGFEEISASYFERVGPQLLQECEEALGETRVSHGSTGFRKVLAKSVLPRLRERWGSSLDPHEGRPGQSSAC